jgi:hypothetical protein
MEGVVMEKFKTLLNLEQTKAVLERLISKYAFPSPTE